MKPTALLSLPGAEEPDAEAVESWDAALLQPAAAIASAEATAVNATPRRRERNRMVKEVLPGGSGPRFSRNGSSRAGRNSAVGPVRRVRAGGEGRTAKGGQG